MEQPELFGPIAESVQTFGLKLPEPSLVHVTKLAHDYRGAALFADGCRVSEDRLGDGGALKTLGKSSSEGVGQENALVRRVRR